MGALESTYSEYGRSPEHPRGKAGALNLNWSGITHVTPVTNVSTRVRG